MSEIILHSKNLEDRAGVKLCAVTLDGVRHERLKSADLSFGYQPTEVTVTFLLMSAPHLVAVDGNGLDLGDLPHDPLQLQNQTFDYRTVLFADDGGAIPFGPPDVKPDCTIAMRREAFGDSYLYHHIPWINLEGHQFDNFSSLSFECLDPYADDPLVVHSGAGNLVKALWTLTVNLLGVPTIQYE